MATGRMLVDGEAGHEWPTPLEGHKTARGGGGVGSELRYITISRRSYI